MTVTEERFHNKVGIGTVALAIVGALLVGGSWFVFSDMVALAVSWAAIIAAAITGRLIYNRARRRAQEGDPRA